MKRLYSRILGTFPKDVLIEICRITYTPLTNAEKGFLIQDTLKKAGIKFLPLGSGTNRLGIQIGEYVFKIALDSHGFIDNRREYKYTDKLQPFVFKVYESLPDGLIIAGEAFNLISQQEFVAMEDQIKGILKEISKNFFIGDIGFTTKNYVNWGIRKTTKELAILDFAYIYSVSYQVFTCTCDKHSFLQYDDNYNNLICPSCERIWSFGEIRKRISRKAQEEEIGNILENSYVLHKPEEYVDEHPEYTYSYYNEYLKKENSKSKKELAKERNREIIQKMKDAEEAHFDEFQPGEATSFEELMRNMEVKYEESK